MNTANAAGWDVMGGQTDPTNEQIVRSAAGIPNNNQGISFGAGASDNDLLLLACLLGGCGK
jgi:hypothetical protein